MSIIYLFSNQQYGQAFIESASDFFSKHQVDMRIVLSGKGNLTTGKIGRLKFFLKTRLLEKSLSKSFGMRVMIIENINSQKFIESICKESIGIVAGFNQIFKAPLINKFKSLVNFHPSLLPYYRGPVPSYWCLYNKEKFTGFTLHKIDRGIDSGEILYQDIVSIPSKIDEKTLDSIISKKAAIVLTEYLTASTSNKQFILKKVNAFEFYSMHPDYLSFP